MKKIDAIVYTSNAGHTKEYAGILAEKCGMRAMELGKAERMLPKGSAVIYMGWLMAGSIAGYKKAAKAFGVRAVCAVGMGADGSQLPDVRKNNQLHERLPLFYLQGGYESDKLKGMYKLMMQFMKNTVGKRIAKKKERTKEEDEMLELMMNGGNRVSEKNLAGIIDWVMERD